MKRIALLALLLLAVFATPVAAAEPIDLSTLGTTMQVPVPVVNPTFVTVPSCPDHDQDTGHDIDILDTAGVVTQTIAGGDPGAAANGSVTFAINVQPVKFGAFTFVVRATAAGIKSPNSPASDPWHRAPGAPGKPVAGK
jgi:hypothetical protein